MDLLKKLKRQNVFRDNFDIKNNRGSDIGFLIDSFQNAMFFPGQF